MNGAEQVSAEPPEFVQIGSARYRTRLDPYEVKVTKVVLGLVVSQFVVFAFSTLLIPVGAATLLMAALAFVTVGASFMLWLMFQDLRLPAPPPIPFRERLRLRRRDWFIIGGGLLLLAGSLFLPAWDWDQPHPFWMFISFFSWSVLARPGTFNPAISTRPRRVVTDSPPPTYATRFVVLIVLGTIGLLILAGLLLPGSIARWLPY